jgi:hypothetical protein
MSDTSSFGYGQLFPEDYANEMSAISFICRQMIAEMDVMKLVQVQAVHGGGIALGGTVDVFPLVNQVDGNFNPVPHGTVYGLPWTRIQGGPNAVICDPQVNDIGYVLCSDRDISSVVSQNGLLSGASLLGTGVNPGSWRKLSICDGIYIGGCLNVTPTQYLLFTTTGVRIVDANGNSITMGASGIAWTDTFGNMLSSTNAGFTVTTVAGADFVVNGISVTKHVHAVTTAPGTTGLPTG